MNVEFKDGQAIMSIEDFMKHFNHDGKQTGTYVAATAGNDIHGIVTNIIMRKGLKPHLLGFKYTRKAVELCLQDDDYLNQITKRLYPDIAKEFKTLPTRAERAIRHSIEVVYPNQKPCNSEFIAQLVEEASFEMREQDMKVS